MKMTENTTSKTYDVWSWFYDKTFGVLVRKRQRRAIEQLRPAPGDRVLDLGVGTGLTLTDYPADVNVVGMDLSPGMLRKAAEKCRRNNLTHCRLVQGDAMLPPFADNSFDHVLITHVISVVSNPPLLLRWAQRLVKPGGRIVVLNHFQSSRRPVAWIEKALNPLFSRIGWKSDLAMEDVLADVDLRVDYVFKESLFDLWRIIVLSKPGGVAKPGGVGQAAAVDDRTLPDAPLAVDAAVR